MPASDVKSCELNVLVAAHVRNVSKSQRNMHRRTERGSAINGTHSFYLGGWFWVLTRICCSIQATLEEVVQENDRLRQRNLEMLSALSKLCLDARLGPDQMFLVIQLIQKVGYLKMIIQLCLSLTDAAY